jgi:hypothetical protein
MAKLHGNGLSSTITFDRLLEARDSPGHPFVTAAGRSTADEPAPNGSNQTVIFRVAAIGQAPMSRGFSAMWKLLSAPNVMP